MEELKVRVGYDPATAPDLADLRRRLDAAIWAELKLEPDVELMTTGELLATSATGKIKRVVNA
jgi:hypothetical protein